MAWVTIVKSPEAEHLPPNLQNYAETPTRYAWEAARKELNGLPGGRGLNIAYEAVDRHAVGPRGSHWPSAGSARAGALRTSPTLQLQRLTSRFANVLAIAGCRAG